MIRLCPPDVENAGRASYVKRNQAMINASEYCIFYYNLDCHAKHQTKSGTRIAFELADQKRKKEKIFKLLTYMKMHLFNNNKFTFMSSNFVPFSIVLGRT